MIFHNFSPFTSVCLASTMFLPVHSGHISGVGGGGGVKERTKQYDASWYYRSTPVDGITMLHGQINQI